METAYIQYFLECQFCSLQKILHVPFVLYHFRIMHTGLLWIPYPRMVGELMFQVGDIAVWFMDAT